MFFSNKKSILWISIFLISCVCFFTGCNASTSKEPIEISSIKLNTAVSIRIYDSEDRTLLDECLKICDKYEKIFSRTNENSELYQLNQRLLPSVSGEHPSEASDESKTFSLSPELAHLIAIGLDYSQRSDGAFDLTIAPLSTLWNFTAENPSIPKASDIQSAASKCDYKNISFLSEDPSLITFASSDCQIDLGAIAKGYIADRIKEYLVSQGVQSAIINLGGNVLCIGQKPDESTFQIGIQKPFANRNETAAIMGICDRSVVSSGIYERCFTQNNTLYHHLLNPKTGYPYNNELISVTIISENSVDGDALSTVCFALGLEKGLELIDSLENTDAVFITNDYELHYSKDFEKNISLTPYTTAS